MEASKDTIAAIATPMGRGGIGIVRISGPAAHQILERVFIPRGGAKAMEPRRLAYGEVYDHEHQVALDQAMAVFMPAPHSFTTEDVVELQCHGGPQVMHAVLDLTLREGARLATPGEFTLRAFLNGRIDLAQAEAVCDLIEAKTPRAASLAARQLAGVLSKQVLSIEEGLLHVLSLITVAVDFPEDADAPSNGELIQLLDQQRLRIVFEIRGEGTDWLARREEGDQLDVLGPLGHGFAMEPDKRYLLVGGGIGVPPMYGLARRLLAAGKTPIAILGFNAAQERFYEEEFRALGVQTVVTTADGSYGVRGFVTDALPEVYDTFCACGPLPMLRALCRAADKPGFLSLEARMGCGFGACMGCTIETLNGPKRVCREGPVFRKEELLW